MPHYANGQQAKEGDIIRGIDFDGNVQDGIVVRITSEGDDCNLEILPIPAQGRLTMGRLTMIARKSLPIGDPGDLESLVKYHEDQKAKEEEKK